MILSQNPLRNMYINMGQKKTKYHHTAHRSLKKPKVSFTQELQLTSQLNYIVQAGVGSSLFRLEFIKLPINIHSHTRTSHTLHLPPHLT